MARYFIDALDASNQLVAYGDVHARSKRAARRQFWRWASLWRKDTPIARLVIERATLRRWLWLQLMWFRLH